MIYTVIDSYINPYGNKIYTTKNKEDAEDFVEKYKKEFNGNCKVMIIKSEEPMRRNNNV